MQDFMGYADRRVVVTGCASGMGRATANFLMELGAEVHGLDFNKTDLTLSGFTQMDLRDAASIREAADQGPKAFDALFNCAGLGPTFSALDIVKVNFIGTRLLTELLVGRITEGGAVASIASTAGMGWSRRTVLLKEFIAAGDYEASVKWVAEHPDEVGEGYAFSKEAVIVWTLQESQQLIRRGIRTNCIMPGLTHTPMMTDQIAVNTSKDMLDQVVQPMGRPATPEEQAFVLLTLNSPRASFLNGAAVNVDGGRIAGLTLGG